MEEPEVRVVLKHCQGSQEENSLRNLGDLEGQADLAVPENQAILKRKTSMRCKSKK